MGKNANSWLCAEEGRPSVVVCRGGASTHGCEQRRGIQTWLCGEEGVHPWLCAEEGRPAVVVWRGGGPPVVVCRGGASTRGCVQRRGVHPWLCAGEQLADMKLAPSWSSLFADCRPDRWRPTGTVYIYTTVRPQHKRRSLAPRQRII
jgi:hypothetical protein